jgi:hypothetical protein
MPPEKTQYRDFGEPLQEASSLHLNSFGCAADSLVLSGNLEFRANRGTTYKKPTD